MMFLTSRKYSSYYKSPIYGAKVPDCLDHFVENRAILSCNMGAVCSREIV